MYELSSTEPFSYSTFNVGGIGADLQMTAMRAEGLSVRAIAERIGVSPMTVSRLLRTR
jgi:plasmid maintenance system antidote protein VapI